MAAGTRDAKEGGRRTRPGSVGHAPGARDGGARGTSRRGSGAGMNRSRGAGVGLALAAGLLGGCGTPAKEPAAAGPRFRGVTVVVAAVGEADVLPTVVAQRGEWQASRGATCEVRESPVGPSETAGAHVLVFRGDRLGDLVDAGALAVLPKSVVQPPAKPDDGADAPSEPATPPGESPADALQFSDVVPAFRDQVSKYGKDRVALPYGGSALVLAFDRTAFDRPENREAARAAGLTLEPPKTWRDLDGLAKFFHGRDLDGDGRADSGIALALGADAEGVGDATYLARAAALGQHRDHYSLLFDADTMRPRVTTPPFVEALEGLVALKAFGPPGVEGFDAEAARKAFREGHAALLIDRAERAASWGLVEKNKDKAKAQGRAPRSIGVAQLPGSGRVYEPSRKLWEDVKSPNRPSYLPFGGGWLVAVAASAKGRDREAAVDLATYLVSPETSSRVRADRDFPMLPVRTSQVAQGLPDPRSAPGVEPRPWADAVAKTLVAPRVVPGLRIPGADGYLADLAAARVDAAKGEPAADALKRAADAWDARTKSLGAARQAWHYQRSLNNLVTAPQPPPR